MGEPDAYLLCTRQVPSRVRYRVHRSRVHVRNRVAQRRVHYFVCRVSCARLIYSCSVFGVQYLDQRSLNFLQGSYSRLPALSNKAPCGFVVKEFGDVCCGTLVIFIYWFRIRHCLASSCGSSRPCRGSCPSGDRSTGRCVVSKPGRSRRRLFCNHWRHRCINRCQLIPDHNL